MNVPAAFDTLDAVLAGVRVGLREDALLAPAARECLGMVRAYRADAAAFAESGDLVNAIAAFAYACGWLDAALVVGLLDGAVPPVPPFQGIGDRDGRLAEKARRYATMLDQAVGAARPGPDRSSPSFAAACGIVAVAGAFRWIGDTYLDRDELAAALSVSSYAYGWLDAGVRAGLVTIAGDRALFAV